MNIFCKLHIHRWKNVGAAGLFAFPLNECQRCGAGKVDNFMSGPHIIPPSDMAEARRKFEEAP